MKKAVLNWGRLGVFGGGKGGARFLPLLQRFLGVSSVHPLCVFFFWGSTATNALTTLTQVLQTVPSKQGTPCLGGLLWAAARPLPPLLVPPFFPARFWGEIIKISDPGHRGEHRREGAWAGKGENQSRE